MLTKSPSKIVDILINKKKIKNISENELKEITKYFFKNRIFPFLANCVESGSINNEKLLTDILNAKYLSHINFISHFNILKKISEEFNKYKIKYVLLKGSALRISVYDKPHQRYARDIDILVCKNQLNDAYLIMRKLGFKYNDQDCSDTTNGTLKYSQHLPKMNDENNIIVELHHRITSPLIYKNCFLSEDMLNNKILIKKRGCNFFIPRPNDLIVHLIYHAMHQKKIEVGPQVFIDVIEILKKNPSIKIEDIRAVAKEDEVLISDFFTTLNMIKNNQQCDLSLIKNKTKTNIPKYILNLPKQISYEKQISMANPLIVIHVIKKILKKINGRLLSGLA